MVALRLAALAQGIRLARDSGTKESRWPKAMSESAVGGRVEWRRAVRIELTGDRLASRRF